MNISAPVNVNYSCKKNNVKFGKNNQNNQQAIPSNVSIDGQTLLPGTKRLNYPPVVVGLMNAFCWFGVGMLCDKLFSFMSKNKSSSKTSVAVNSIIAAGMGTYSYIQAKKMNKKV